jgi:hypothetical protein
MKLGLLATLLGLSVTANVGLGRNHVCEYWVNPPLYPPEVQCLSKLILSSQKSLF